ncbi:MAG TPA: winged helix-turn-helix domain-containing protein [Vicinamibacterales bacterium]|nr:winged helix-turn-helix domain-containing protein [Vicinamibacterales bacterium]
MPQERLRFGELTIDVAERRVTCAGRDVALAPKAHDVLAYLTRHAGHLVSKQDLLDAIWPDAFVEEGILAVHISALRKALADDPRAPRYIQTVSKSGYRFLGSDGSRTSVGTGADTDRARRADVYELVGQGRRLLLSSKFSNLPEARRLLESAIALDAAYAPAHAVLALVQCARVELRQVQPAAGFAEAKASALRALGLDDESVDARVALGAVLMLSEWDWSGAERSFQRALELSPHHTQARLLYGRLLDAIGQTDDGLAMKLRALEDDPFSPAVHLAIALSYWHQRRFDDTIRWARKTLELDASHLLAREFLAGAYWAMGDFDRHMTENLAHAATFGVSAEALDPLRERYAAEGRAGVLRMSLEQAAAGPGFPEAQLALVHGELGNLDEAMAHLERAIEGRDPCLVDLAVAPQWDSLRAHPGFGRCLAHVGLAR